MTGYVLEQIYAKFYELTFWELTFQELTFWELAFWELTFWEEPLSSLVQWGWPSLASQTHYNP